MYVFRQHADGTPVDLEDLRGISLEPDEELIILVMNTDDLLILYTDSALARVDALEKLINTSFEASRIPWTSRRHDAVAARHAEAARPRLALRLRRGQRRPRARGGDGRVVMAVVFVSLKKKEETD